MAYRSLSRTTYASRTNIVITAPSGVVDGDMLILFHILGASGGPTTPTPPAGWTILSGFPSSASDGSFVVVTRVYWRVASSEGASYTFTHSATSSQGAVVCLSSASSSTPLASVATGTGTTSTAPAVTAPDAGGVIFWSQNWDLFGAASPPTGTTPTFTERLDAADSLLYLATGDLAASGSTGTKAHANGNGGGGAWQAGLVYVADGAPPAGQPAAARMRGVPFTRNQPLFGRGF